MMLPTLDEFLQPPDGLQEADGTLPPDLPGLGGGAVLSDPGNPEDLERNDAREEYQRQPLLPELQRDDASQYAVTRLMGLFNEYSSCWERLRQQRIWDACDRAYEGRRPARLPIGFYYSIRETFRQVETAGAQINRQLLGGQKFFRYAPRAFGQDEACAQASATVHDQLQRFQQIKHLRKWNKVALRLGTSYLGWEWADFRRFPMKLSDLHAPYGTPIWERTTSEVVQGAPQLAAFSPRCIYTHPAVEDVRLSPVTFVSKTVSAADLKTLVRERWLDAVRTRKAVESGWTTRYGNDGSRRPQWDEMRGVLDGDDPHHMLICLLPDGMEYVILDGAAGGTSGSGMLLRGQRCPYGEMSLLDLRNYPQEDQHYGYGEPLVIMEEQNLLNDFCSVWVASQHINCTPMFKMTNNVHRAYINTTWQPGGALVVSSPAELAEIQNLNAEIKPTQIELANTFPMLLENMRVSTGQTSEAGGLGSNQKTATGVVRMQEAANIRIEDKVVEFTPQYEELYRAMFNLNARNASGNYTLRIAGDPDADVFNRWQQGRKAVLRGSGYELMEVTPKIFEADVDVQVELGNVMETSAEAANSADRLFQQFNGDPLVDQEELRRFVLRSHGVARPEQMMTNALTQQANAQRENRMATAGLPVPAPRASDDHMLHFEEHLAELQANPSPELTKHARIHYGYVQAMQRAQAQTMQLGMQQPTAQNPVPESEVRTEAQFANGDTGAAQQGVVAA